MPTLILDIDGVVLDYYSGLLRFLALKGLPVPVRPSEIADYSMAQIFPDIPYEKRLVHVREFAVTPAFGLLRYFDNAVGAVRSLRGRVRDLQVVAVTSAGGDPVTAILRKRNLTALALDAVHVLPLCGSKLDAYKQFEHGGVVIDDIEDNLDAAYEAGHHGFLFRQPWNAGTRGHEIIENWFDNAAIDEIEFQLRRTRKSRRRA